MAATARSLGIFQTDFLKLQKKDIASTLPSSGGFTVLGKNPEGQDIIRDNVTGEIKSGPEARSSRVAPQFGPSPRAKALGPQKGPLELARGQKGRRRGKSSRGKEARGTQASRIPNLLGKESILGQPSILG